MNSRRLRSEKAGVCLLDREAEAALRKGAAREAEALRASSEHLRTSLEAEQLAR